MTWWSTSCRRLREAKQHGGVPNAPATIKPAATASGFNWFFQAAASLRPRKESREKSNVSLGDPESGTDATEDTADGTDELNELLLDNPRMSGAALANSLTARGLKVVKITASFQRHVQNLRETAAKGVDPKKFDSCVTKVKKSGSADNAYAVCNASLQSAVGNLLGQGLKGKSFAREASTVSANTQMVREARIRFRATNLRESAAANDGIGPTTFKCVLLMEGLGNFNDAYYYDKAALESAVPLFAGAKIYADHPSLDEEETRPERSVRDVLGHFDNIQIEESKDGRAMLTGEVNILPDTPYDWARALMREAIEHAKKFPDKDLIGLSINASGGATELPIDDVIDRAPEGALVKLVEAKNQGIDSVRVVSKLDDAISCDMVTEAGAGGKILTAIQ